MRVLSLRTQDGRHVACNVRFDSSFLSGLVGSLRASSPGAYGGLLLSPGGSVHTLGRRTPIDVVFLTRQMRVVGLAAGVPPWRFRFAPAGTGRVLELPDGRIAAAGLQVGMYIVVDSDDGERRHACRAAHDSQRPSCRVSPLRFSLRLPLERKCMPTVASRCSVRRLRGIGVDEQQ